MMRLPRFARSGAWCRVALQFLRRTSSGLGEPDRGTWGEQGGLSRGPCGVLEVKMRGCGRNREVPRVCVMGEE